MIPILKGPDVSAWQGAVDWEVVKHGGASFAFCKASEGTSAVDACFVTNWAGIQGAGLLRGAYHFAMPHQGNAPSQEAQHFSSVVGPLATWDMLVLDLEVPTDGREGEYAAWALTWLQQVEALYGVPPLLYTDLGYAEVYLLHEPALAHYPLWLALYGATCPRAVGPWAEVSLWQHTSSATWPGIGSCDESLLARDLDGLRRLGKQPIEPIKATKWLVLVDMMLRAAPDVRLRRSPLQMCYKGAVLDGTGQIQNGWVEVTAGGHQGWLLERNLEPAT